MIDEKEYGLHRLWKIFMLVGSPAMFVISYISIIDCYYDDNLYVILLAGIPMIVVTVFTFIYPLISKIRCGSNYIEKIDFGSRKILYEDVNKVWLSENFIVIKSSKTTIKIGQDLDKQKEIISIVIDNLRSNPNFEIKGNKKNKRKYFPDRI